MRFHPSDAAGQPLAEQPFSVYIHVPFCAARCGYCDFNTYVLGSMGAGAVQTYLDAAHTEIETASAQFPALGPARTVFFGGGTPTMLTPAQLGGLIEHVRNSWGMTGDAEVTTEANPETLSTPVLDGLLEAGVNRLSMGMQSADRGVLKLLDRVHTPGRAVDMARLARERGFDDISLDLIFGTPGESLESWRRSLETALEAEPDHISAYSLIVEEGTRLAARIRRGEVPMTDEDDLADKYLAAEETLTGAGFVNYEVSNWARPGTGPDGVVDLHRAEHNMAYWLGDDWWGIGPGAHSHVGQARWWNVKHPARYAALCSAGELPVDDGEVLGPEERHEETVLLRLRLADGLPVAELREEEVPRAAKVVTDGLGTETDGVLRLNLEGRLLADRIITELLV
ncbi:radical SAM family heme chaperone HemW [Acidipropionibacterium virtanenii]|uniref:Heme chaperone HemW n=1 Tax=Acidipropionibacterium virtanenii TaxID=2057246 RepID=A0A344UUY6_9ACTN|nr:radical SAM family heme chaperone HemW [Acidipropionibacterium virtanenii]AXE39084.1 Oxygen-independent coproporphyrinogen-III oxidase-like protein [Acidipropionibacterium virtanenii]